MRFVETRVFTDLVCKTLEDDEYRALQSSLPLRPEQGPVIPGSGGLRKWLERSLDEAGRVRSVG